MLRELPIQTIDDVGRLGLELHIYCSSCNATRRLNIDRAGVAGRSWSMARFRCARCGTIGAPKIRPAKLLSVGGPVTLAFLVRNRCVWQIDQVQLDRSPWSGSDKRYRCPSCSGPVQWHIHGPAWRPLGSSHA